MLQKSKLSCRFTNREIISDSKEVSTSYEELSETKLIDGKIKENLKKAFLNKIESIPVWHEYNAGKQKDLIKSFIINNLTGQHISINEEELDEISGEFYKNSNGFGLLDNILANENVSSVFVNGTNNIFIGIDGKTLNTELKPTKQQLNFILKKIYSHCKQDNNNFIKNFTTEKFHISVIMPPVAVNGICIIFKKIVQYDINSIISDELLTQEIFDFLINAVADKKNIIISGDINSGKTALLNSLISSIHLRTVIFEEYPQLLTENDFMRFIVNENISKDLFSTVVKILPEYFVCDLNKPVVELVDFKSISTLRANSVEAALTKLISSFVCEENYPEKLAKTKVLSNYDYIVQINKSSGGERKLTSIVELKQARTNNLSVTEIVKLVDNEYICEIPQPLTSLKAKMVITGTKKLNKD